jgi:hypothetical protein
MSSPAAAADAAVGFIAGIMGGPRRLFRRAAGGLDAASRLVEDGGARLLSALHRGRACRDHRRARTVALDRKGLVLLGLALPAWRLARSWAGILYGRLDEKRFRQALAIMLLLFGRVLIVLERVKEEVEGGDLAVPGDDEIGPGVSRRLAGAAGYPPDATAIAQLSGGEIG